MSSDLATRLLMTATRENLKSESSCMLRVRLVVLRQIDSMLCASSKMTIELSRETPDDWRMLASRM